MNKIDLNFFHIKIPIDVIRRGTWLNLTIDVLSFMEGFKGTIIFYFQYQFTSNSKSKGQTFRSLDGIVVNAVCKLRKIFTLRYPPFIFKLNDEDPAEYRELYNA